MTKCKMDEAARLARNEYQREWYRKHPEKQREYRRRYWEKKAAQKAKESEETGDELHEVDA